jgi:hypothetical protein
MVSDATTTIPLWPRDSFTTGGAAARFALVALSDTRMPEPLPISRSKHGMPSSMGAAAVALVVHERATDETWFTDNIVTPFSPLVEADINADNAALVATMQFAYIISCDCDDPDDLTHLQATWALAKCICEQGATVVIDVSAARAHLGKEIAALLPSRDFDIMHEVALFFDDRPQGSMIAWTAGMQKFGRPNLLIAHIDRDYAAVVATTLRDAAFALADGERLEIGDTLEIENRTFVAAPIGDQHGTPIDGAALALQQLSDDDAPPQATEK